MAVRRRARRPGARVARVPTARRAGGVGVPVCADARGACDRVGGRRDLGRSRLGGHRALGRSRLGRPRRLGRARVAVPVDVGAARAGRRLAGQGCRGRDRRRRGRAVHGRGLAGAPPPRRPGRVAVPVCADARGTRRRMGGPRCRTARTDDLRRALARRVLDTACAARPARDRRVAVGAHPGRTAPRRRRTGDPGRPRTRVARGRADLARRRALSGEPLPVDLRRADPVGVPDRPHTHAATSYAMPCGSRSRRPGALWAVPLGRPWPPPASPSARPVAGVRSALFGQPTRPPSVHGREPRAAETRTLGSSKTALTKD